jgi:two-component system OmpR family sensor kinase
VRTRSKPARNPPRNRASQTETLAALRARVTTLKRQVARLQARNKKAAAEEALLLARAAHELRTPVTSLRGFTQLLARQVEDPDPDKGQLVEAIAAMRRQSERVIHLIGELLEVSRIDRGERRLERRVSEVTSVVKRAVSAATMAEPDAVFRVHAPEEVLALVDPRSVEQVVTNLLNNAERYSPRGEPIEVDIRRKGIDKVLITVTDRGAGIPEAFRPHIFDRFSRGESGGLGLGLYICKELVEGHGGTIEAHSHGRGTRVEVVLPVGRRGRP